MREAIKGNANPDRSVQISRPDAATVPWQGQGLFLRRPQPTMRAMRSPALSAAFMAAIVSSCPAGAAERRWAVGSFERVRIEGPVAVSITAGSPRAAATGGQAILDRVTITSNGGMLVVRIAGRQWRGETGAAEPLAAVSLATPRLTSVMLAGGASVTVAGVSGERVDLTLNGAGTLDATGIDATMLSATLVGGDTMTLAGRAATARLMANGTGSIAAEALRVDTLSVQRTDAGETRATARYTATVMATQKGRVTVTGTNSCDVRATNGAQVRCGK